MSQGTSDTSPISRLSCWVIYERPDDYPTGYILKKWSALGGIMLDSYTSHYATIDEARSRIPADKKQANLDANDIPAIVEVWI